MKEKFRAGHKAGC